MRRSKTIKGKLGLNGSFSVYVRHEVNIGQIREVIFKDSGTFVASIYMRTTMNWNKAGNRTYKLIHTNDLTRGGSRTEDTVLFDTFSVPWATMGLAVIISGTDWWINRSKMAWDSVNASKKFEVSKAKVPKIFMPCHELCLFTLINKDQ